jgi:hypothetical protein
LVNINRLVETSIKILRLLLDKSLHYNEIIRQTSPDRTHVDNAIDVLDRGQLIMEYQISKRERKQQKIHSQARIMQITDLGRELIDILVSLEQYKKAYYELKKPIDEYFTKWRSEQSNSIRDNILRKKGFTDDDLELYNESYNGAMVATSALVTEILEVITTRCALRLYRFEITDIAEDILNNIIINAVTFRVSLLLKGIKSHESIPFNKEDLNAKEQGGGSYIGPFVIQDLIMKMPMQYYFPSAMHKEVKNAILSYLSLLKPSKESIQYTYEMIKNGSEELGRDYPSLPHHATCLFDVYEAYMGKSD